MQNSGLSWVFLLLISWISLFKGAICLRINRLEVPPAIQNGTGLFLFCYFDLEGETLYSVKWYKNYVEFYRFMPSNVPRPAQIVRLKGTFVELSLSNATHVFLDRTDLDSEGTYTCEVSTESPAFSTIKAEQQMKVYVLPEESLRMEGKELAFDVGDLINLTCASGGSRPAPKLSWFVNEEMAFPSQLIQYPVQTLANGLHSRRLGIAFEATSDLFPKGLLRLRCSATILLSYKFEAIETLTGGTPTNKSHGLYLNKGRSIQRAREAPFISGGKSRYKVGEWLSLNCTTAAHDVHLKWYINEVQVDTRHVLAVDTTNALLLTPGSQATPVQTKEYEATDGSHGWVLGLKLYMQKLHFQVPELRLKCVAIFHDIIKEFDVQMAVVTKNQEVIQAQSAVNGVQDIRGKAPVSGLIYLLTLFINMLIYPMHYLCANES